MGKPQRELDPFRDELAALRSALGNRIRELRKLKGWSQEDFSSYAHIHRTFAGALERGEKNLSFHALVLIARCFGLSLSELLAGVEKGEPARVRRKSGQDADMDRTRIIRELAAAEKSIQAAKEIALPDAKTMNVSVGKKRSKR